MRCVTEGDDVKFDGSSFSTTEGEAGDRAVNNRVEVVVKADVNKMYGFLLISRRRCDALFYHVT